MFQANPEKAKLEDFELTLFDRINVIRDVIEKYGEDKFHLSFSGGGDSTILHYLLDEALPGNKIPRVYINTGIEYTDIVEFVKQLAKEDDRIVILPPKTNIKQMLNEYGYPLKSKVHSHNLRIYQNNGYTDGIDHYVKGIRPNGEKSNFKCPEIFQHQFTPDFKLKVSEKCCDVMKKHVSREYEKETGREIPITGVRQAEGGTRYTKTECIVKSSRGKVTSFKPLNPVSNEFMDWYLTSRGIKLCKLYYPPFNFVRTGCKGCPFALHLQDELDAMEKYLPHEKEQCELIWKPAYDEYRRWGYRLRRVDASD